MRYLIAFCLLSPLSAWAGDWCHDLWLTRNLIMDRAGYCFGSVLGQTVFDNADCTGKTVTLSPAATQQVNEIRAKEQFQGCKVDTTRRVLNVEDLFVRRQLIDLPIRDEFESACLGWLGPVTMLHSGHSSNSSATAHIQQGDYVYYSHIPVGSWTYVTVQTPDWQVKGGGWLNMAASPEKCQEIAG